MIRRMLPVIVALSIVYGTFWIAQGRIDSDSLCSLLILMGAVFLCGVIGAVRKPRLRTVNVGHAPVATRRHKIRVSDFAAFDDSDVERLRRQWQVDAYDPGYSAHHEFSANSRRDNIDDSVINPATGLPMVGGVGGLDVSGHAFGTGFEHDGLNHWHSVDDTSTRNWDDNHRPDDSHVRFWD